MSFDSLIGRTSVHFSDAPDCFGLSKCHQHDAGFLQRPVPSGWLGGRIVASWSSAEDRLCFRSTTADPVWSLCAEAPLPKRQRLRNVHARFDHSLGPDAESPLECPHSRNPPAHLGLRGDGSGPGGRRCCHNLQAFQDRPRSHNQLICPGWDLQAAALG